jgi:hypothetical protein
VQPKQEPAASRLDAVFSASLQKGTVLWVSAIHILLATGALVASETIKFDDWWAHGIWCTAAALSLLWLLWRTLRYGMMLVFMDHAVMLCLSFGLYFVFGASLLVIGPEDQIAYTLSYYATDAKDGVYVDAINSFGLSIALAVAVLCPSRWIASRVEKIAQSATVIPDYAAILIFGVIGAVTTAYMAWFDATNQSSQVLSGLLRSSTRLSFIAIFLSVVYVGRAQFAVRIFGLFLTALCSGYGLLILSKSEAILPVAVALAGYGVQKRSMLLLPMSALVLGVMLASLGGVVAGARSESGATSFADPRRIESLAAGFSSEQRSREVEEYAWWARLCYLVPQAAAIDFHDAGAGGDDFQLLPWLFLPRVLFPSKPVITDTSVDFNEKLTGSRTSSTGLGIFASGYYSGGWFGLIVASLLCGIVVAQTSAVARSAFQGRVLVLLPLALLGVYIAFRIDGHFVADFVGAFVFLLYLVIALSVLVTVSRPRRR